MGPYCNLSTGPETLIMPVKNVVVIDSGAGHITMLQRSPTSTASPERVTSWRPISSSTATGLNLWLWGAKLGRNGQDVDVSKSMTYKSMLLSDVPTMAFTMGYINASWTLRADLVSEYVCRLLNCMDARGYDTVVAAHPGRCRRRTLRRFRTRLLPARDGPATEGGISRAMAGKTPITSSTSVSEISSRPVDR